MLPYSRVVGERAAHLGLRVHDLTAARTYRIIDALSGPSLELISSFHATTETIGADRLRCRGTISSTENCPVVRRRPAELTS